MNDPCGLDVVPHVPCRLCGHAVLMLGPYPIRDVCDLCHDAARQRAKAPEPTLPLLVPVFIDRDETTRDAPCGLEYTTR